MSRTTRRQASAASARTGASSYAPAPTASTFGVNGTCEASGTVNASARATTAIGTFNTGSNNAAAG